MSFTYARAVLRRSLHRSRWKMRCMSIAFSFSRVVCSTYSFVFFGTSSGMSCSGGGPGGAVDASRLALRFRILITSPPDLSERIRQPSSRPKVPNLHPMICSSTEKVCTRYFPLYRRTSPLFRHTISALLTVEREVLSTVMHEIGCGIVMLLFFFPFTCYHVKGEKNSSMT